LHLQSLGKVPELNNGSKTMGFKKFIKSVQEIYSSESERTVASRDRIEELLGELEKKEKKLNHKLSEENDSKKRKDLKLKLKIISTQRNKGMALLDKMEKESH
jgi:23S rRNA C2498 (ribose-2'-O)-methylase RlmM